MGECATSRNTLPNRFLGGSVCTSAEAYKKSIARLHDRAFTRLHVGVRATVTMTNSPRDE
jgi:hypothetical protein